MKDSIIETLSPRQALLYKQVKCWFGGKTRKFTKECYVDGHCIPVGIRAEEMGIAFGWEKGLLHDLFEDVDVFLKTSDPDFILRGHMIAYGYTDRECDFIIPDVIELTDQFTSADYPGLDRAYRKRCEMERLGECIANVQNMKCVDMEHNILAYKGLSKKDKGKMNSYMATKRLALKFFKNAGKDFKKLVTNALKEIEENGK